MIAMVLKMAINLLSTESEREAIKLFTFTREVENPTLVRGCHIIGLVITPVLSGCGRRVDTQEGRGEINFSWGQFKCDGTCAEIKFRLSAKRTSPFKSVRMSVQSTTDSRAVRISGSNAGYTMFRGSVKSTGYPLHSSVSPSLLLPCVTLCHHISTGLYDARALHAG